MPRILRPDPLPPLDDAWSEADPPNDVNDVDDNIHLSDLLRTGEASRLRRRGAMRLDHAPTHSHLPHSPTVIVIDTSPSSSSLSDQEREPLGTGAAHRRRPTRERPARRETLPTVTPDECYFSLFCGGTEDICLQDNTPFQPSILPTSGLSHSRQPPGKRTNGCGALLHMRGSPRSDQGVWQAKGPATDAVIGMDARYFDRSAIAKAVRSSCGCIREGVGCAVCGNPLGTRYKPCKSAGSSILCSSAKPPGALIPEGPHYWRASLSAPSGPSMYIYTFLPSAVSSDSLPSFPSRSPAPPPPTQPSSSSRPAFPPDTEADSLDTPVFDRFLTSSPQPVSEIDEPPRDEEETRFAYWQDEISGYPPDDDNNNDALTVTGPRSVSRQATIRPDQFLSQAEFDPDGEFLDVDYIVEPGSPDKGFEPVLFP